MKVIGYVRVSSEKQVDGSSLDNQPRRIREYCAAKGLPVPEILEDAAVSSKVPFADREAGAEVVARLRPGDHFVLNRLDRAWRSTADFLHWFDLWRGMGVRIHILNFGGQEVDSSTPVGRMMVQIVAVLAEFERGMLSERIKEEHAHLRSQGLYHSRHCPAGLRSVRGPNGKGWRRVSDPAQRAVMAKIVEWADDKRFNFDQIADHLRVQKVVFPYRATDPRQYKGWDGNKVRKLYNQEKALRTASSSGGGDTPPPA